MCPSQGQSFVQTLPDSTGKKVGTVELLALMADGTQATVEIQVIQLDLSAIVELLQQIDRRMAAVEEEIVGFASADSTT